MFRKNEGKKRLAVSLVFSLTVLIISSCSGGKSGVEKKVDAKIDSWNSLALIDSEEACTSEQGVWIESICLSTKIEHLNIQPSISGSINARTSNGSGYNDDGSSLDSHEVNESSSSLIVGAYTGQITYGSLSKILQLSFEALETKHPIVFVLTLPLFQIKEKYTVGEIDFYTKVSRYIGLVCGENPRDCEPSAKENLEGMLTINEIELISEDVWDKLGLTCSVPIIGYIKGKINIAGTFDNYWIYNSVYGSDANRHIPFDAGISADFVVPISYNSGCIVD